MQTTLRIEDQIYREAKADAARRGMTLTRYIEAALSDYSKKGDATPDQEASERDQMMEALLRRTARFRVGRRPSREEMNER